MHFGGKVDCPNQIWNSSAGPAWRSTTFDSNSSPLWVLNRKNFNAPLLSDMCLQKLENVLEMSWKKFICNAIFSWRRVMFFENVYFRVFYFRYDNRFYPKGHLISEWIYEVIVSPKIRTKNCQDFCPHYTRQKSWQLFVRILGETMTS